MNIDLLPFSAFALESSPGASQPPGESDTLTMPLGLAPAHPALGPAMEGSVEVAEFAPGEMPVLGAAVVPVAGPALTITF